MTFEILVDPLRIELSPIDFQSIVHTLFTPQTLIQLRFHEGKRLRIHKAMPASASGMPGELVGVFDGFPVIACGESSLQLLHVQPEGKNVRSADEWLRGSRMKLGDKLD